MKVSDLIAELSKLPPDLVVVHSTGMMQDREEVSYVCHGEPNQSAWTTNTEIIRDGNWVEIA